MIRQVKKFLSQGINSYNAFKTICKDHEDLKVSNNLKVVKKLELEMKESILFTKK